MAYQDIMNKKLLVVSLIFFASHTNAMDKPLVLPEEKSVKKNKRLYVCSCVCNCANKTTINNSEDCSSIFKPQLPTELVKHIIINGSESLQDAAQLTSVFAQINKTLHNLLNNDAMCLKLIKNLSASFNSSNEEVAETLQIKSARNRFYLQHTFRGKCENSPFCDKYISNTFGNLKKDDVYLDFTYGKNHLTALMFTTAYPNENEKIAKWLIENGANINAYTKDDFHTSYYAVQCQPIVPLLLKHPEFRINLRGQNGNTPLINLLLHISAWNHGDQTEKLYIATQQLLESGADPELANNKGMTPAYYANLKTGYPKFAQLITDAIDKKYK